MKLTDKYADTSYIKFRDNHTNVVLEDKGCSKVSYRGKNPDKKELIAYKIDRGIMKNHPGKKCDFGLYTISSGVLRFIELKGSDCSKAVEQIMESIRYMLGDGSITGVENAHGRIVLTKYKTPDVKSSKEKELRALLLKKYNGNLNIKSGVLKEDID